jgi:hypothetical protein
MVGFESQINGTTALGQGLRRLGVNHYVLTFEAGIVAFAVGVVAYFTWPTEPNPYIAVVLALIMSILTWRASEAWLGDLRLWRSSRQRFLGPQSMLRSHLQIQLKANSA